MSDIKEKLLYLESFIDPLKSYYDYILIDVPPTKPVIIDNVVLSSLDK